MKMKTLACCIVTCSLIGTSCVWDESVEGMVQKQETVVYTDDLCESRAGDNIMVLGKDSAAYTSIDWSGNYTDSVFELFAGDESTSFYTYNGTGGKMTMTEGRPSIIYGQEGNWLNSGFLYAVADAGLWRNNDRQLSWSDAFASVSFRIHNELSSVYLEVRGIRLCKISTEGTFIFPVGDKAAGWKVGKAVNKLAYRCDTLDVYAEEDLVLPADSTLPLIPQVTEVWDAGWNPDWTTGTYVMVDCRIYGRRKAASGDMEDSGYLIWGGDEGGFAEAAVPVALDTRIGELSTVVISLDETYQWYDVSDGKPVKILRPIVFEPTVDDWQNEGSVALSS